MAADAGDQHQWLDQLVGHPDLPVGTNTLCVFSADTSGNVSLTNSLTFDYAVGAPLTVADQPSRLGTITPNDNGAWLVIGTNTYALKAAAAGGFVFSNWTSSLGWRSIRPS